MLPIQFGHLDAVGARIGPVQVLPQPVHRHPLWIVQAKLHHMLQSAAIHEGPTDGLQREEEVKGLSGEQTALLLGFTSFNWTIIFI